MYARAQTQRNEHIYATLTAPPISVPRLVFWPEGATLRLLELKPESRSALVALLGPHDILITGGDSVTLDLHGSDDVYHNSVFALNGAGNLLWRFDKAHLVPFGEYLPVRSILGRMGLSRFVPGDGDFTPGPGPRTLPLSGFGGPGPPISVGVQICYEIIFSGRVIDETHRPSFLFNPSDDAWFGGWGPPQHLAQAQLRAIEEGVPVIRATPNGISALIAPTGRLIATISEHQAGVIDAHLPQSLPPTVFSRLGLWSCALFGVCLMGIGLLVGAKLKDAPSLGILASAQRGAR
jgi:apolipoprotein N-acyltransferase